MFSLTRRQNSGPNRRSQNERTSSRINPNLCTPATLELTGMLVGTTHTTGIISSDHGEVTRQPLDILIGSFSVISGPCTTSLAGRCVGRRYSEQNPWPSIGNQGDLNIRERCEIEVLRAGALAPSALFDTVSYVPNGNRPARHDAVGLHGSSCDTYVSSDRELPDPIPPVGCYAGDSGPPAGTALATGEILTWAAAGDYDYANTQAEDHDGWTLCFV
eukprot:COSAG02_NODE_6243_length_3704_cov_12.964494_2_plen_217_part_00